MSVTATDLLDRPPALFGDSIVRVEPIDRKTAGGLLIAWDHPLGPCDRPFGQDHWLLVVAGRPVALAVSASIISPTIRDEHDATWPRNRTLELARIARHPEAPWAMRVMLRLWREALVPEWTHWTPELLVSYAMPGKTGDIYRFDGWTFVRWTKPAKPGASSTWSHSSATDQLGDGRKGLWVWHRSAS
jgi:hypothetical protein